MVDVQQTSTSELITLMDCPKKFQFRYRRGLIPQSSHAAMGMGTLYHAGAASGYAVLKSGFPGEFWLTAALSEVTKKNPVDRDGIPLALSDEQTQVVCDMLSYFDEYGRIHDDFDEIVAIEEPCVFTLNGYTIRTTMDLLVRKNNRFEVYDHKTSGDIAADQAHLPLDLQLHLYYYSVTKRLGAIPSKFVHSYMRRFDFSGSTRVGPPGWTRANGEQPYRLTASGKVATRSDDPNEYCRRVSTPLTENQLRAFERELIGKLQMLQYHDLSGVWPRHDKKGAMGCGGCSYYSICCVEHDGHEANPALLDVLFRQNTEAPAIAGKRFG
jgi:PD-(D/E)XK nuclease superfamily